MNEHVRILIPYTFLFIIIFPYLPLWVDGGARRGRSQSGNSVEGEEFSWEEICFVKFECFESSAIEYPLDLGLGTTDMGGRL